MKNIDFSKDERDAIIYVIKLRIASITSEPGWSGYSKKWKNENYQPLRTSKWKLEDNNIKFSKSELYNMESCLNEYSPIKTFNHPTGLKLSKKQESFLSAFNKVKN